MSTRIVIATGNAGKWQEIRTLLAPAGFDVVRQSDFAVPEAEETGFTFVENALIKARNASQHAGLPAIADDSGLEVDVLDGAPGIHSARYAGAGAGDADNNRKLLSELKRLGAQEPVARFQCVIVFLRHPRDPVPLIAQGTWEGRIVDSPRGTQGFGYDPLFFVPSEDCTAAELPPERKNHLSHRGQALSRLMDLMKHRR